MDLKSQNLSKSLKIPKVTYKDLLIFLIPCIIFLYYLYIYNPALFTIDSYSQLHQIAKGEFNNWHPFFHTFIEMLCIKLYPNPASIGILQILVFSTIWAIICRHNRKSNRAFIFQVVVTFIICLIPLNAMYSITLWKDILFSYLMLFLCFLIQVMVDKNCDLDYKFVILISAVMACISQLRLNGIYVIILLLIVLAIYLFKGNKRQKLYITIPVLTFIFILLIASLSVVYEVKDTQTDSVSAKIAHMLADYDLNLDLSPEDRNKIHEWVPENLSKEKYDLHYIDPIRDNANHEAYDNDKETYIGLAIKYSLKNPIHFLEYLFGSSAMVWDITRDTDWKGITYAGATDTGPIDFYKKHDIVPKHYYECATNVNVGTDQFNQLNSFVEFTEENSLWYCLFNSPALYMYLSIIVLAGIHILTRSKEIYLVYMPNLINIVIIFFSTPIQDIRYLYPNFLIFYLLVIILIGILTTKYFDKDKTNIKNFNNEISDSNKTQYGAVDLNNEGSVTNNYLEEEIRRKILAEINEGEQIKKKER